MKATLILRERRELQSGDVLEMVVWRVAQPVPPCGHDYKYRLVLIRQGQRLVGYDNERGKGDHRHLDGREESYVFQSPERLIEDFLADVQRRLI